MMTLRNTCGRRVSACLSYLVSHSGAAAAEFALLVTLLSIPILNVVDLGIYVYQRMELDNATQVGVQAAWAIVPNCTLPLTGTTNGNANCPSLGTAISNAIQSTPLSTAITVSTPVENYECVDASGNVSVFPITNPPPTCSDGKPAGDYLLITASYAYAPVFTGVSVAGLLTTPITRTAMTRLN